MNRKNIITRPFLACDIDFSKLTYPVMVFPKLDGVRGLVVDSALTSRSFKPFPSKLNTSYFSHSRFNGFDGELTAYTYNSEHLCTDTTSALSTIESSTLCVYNLFDYTLTPKLPYHKRYSLLKELISELPPSLKNKVNLVPFVYAYSKEEILELDADYIAQGYEGTIVRSPYHVYKEGRATSKEASYLRLKAWTEAEIVITDFNEGETNLNEEKLSPTGQVERSTHYANKVPNGMIGSIEGVLLSDTQPLGDGRSVFPEKLEITVAAGKLTSQERKFYFENPDKILGKIVKVKFFPTGGKDKPRMPTFQSFRMNEDMS